MKYWLCYCLQCFDDVG